MILSRITPPASIFTAIYSLFQLLFIAYDIIDQIVDKTVPSGKLSGDIVHEM